MATTTRAKVTNKPSLKSQGAGYSTTNSKGVTTFYKSAKDAPGFSDNSKGKAVSSVDKTGQAIPMTALQNTDVANVPPPPTYSNPGVFTAPKITTATDVNQGFQNNQDWLTTALQSAYNEVGTGESRLAKLEKDNQLKQKEQAVSNAQEQLNQIQTQSQAQQLALEGQGRGQTSAFVGGEQARINREAAIAALPVQAQLAAAQNNLEMAQTHIDKLYSIQSQDAQTKYQYKTKVIESIYNFANAQQQRQLDQLNLQESRKYDEKKTNIAYQRDLASQATQSGQSALAGSLMRLDPNSPTYTNDLARLGGQVVDTTAQLQRASLQANIDTEKLQQEKLLKEITGSNDGAANADLQAYGNEYAATGKLPAPSALKAAGLTAGQIADYAKQVPKSNGVLVSKNTGAVDTRVGAAEQEDIKRLYNITQMVAELKELDANRIGGLIAGTVGKVAGSDAQGAYLTKRKAIVDEIARMQTGAALTKDEQDFYNDYLPGRFSEPLGLGRNSDKVIEDFSKIMNDKLANTLANNQMAIYGYTKTNVPDVGEKTVGEILDFGGVQYRVLPDGTLTDVI